MYDVITIADSILKIAKQQGKRLTPMQLMKLVYIAHGWSLGLRGQDLFADRIEAWKFGPVIPELYHATKRWGREPIPLDKVTGDMEVDPSTEAFLRDVFSKYGHMDGIRLSNLTHKPGTPWQQVYREGSFGREIPDDLIRRHYEQLLHDRSRASAAN